MKRSRFLHFSRQYDDQQLFWYNVNIVINFTLELNMFDTDGCYNRFHVKRETARDAFSSLKFKGERSDIRGVPSGQLAAKQS